MSVMMGVTPAFAASGTSDSDVYKEETVYVNAKASGKTDKVTVSNWLKNSGSVSGRSGRREYTERYQERKR